jgi:beta-N-acetylhexosaminidase
MSFLLKAIKYQFSKFWYWSFLICWTLYSSAFSQTVTISPLSQYNLNDLRVLVGQRLLICVDYPNLSREQKWLLQNGWVGGIVLFDQDVKSPELLRQYIESIRKLSRIPLLVTIDQEGGNVRRLREEQGFQYIPSEEWVGLSKYPSAAHDFGVKLGKQLKSVGIDLNFAPVVDLDPNQKDSVITKYQRALGNDPQRIALLAGQIIDGMKSQGVIAAAKHFPGESQAYANPHDEIAVTDSPLEEMQERDLVPYKQLIKSGLQAVMVSHVVYSRIDSEFPASLSKKIIDGLLRKDLGFQGVVICDDLEMEAIKRKYTLPKAAICAADAGVDLIIATGDTGKLLLDTLVSAVQTGRLSKVDAQKSYDRIMKLKKINILL